MKMHDVFAAIAAHKQNLPPGAVERWAFLVTFDELADLVTECQNDPALGQQLDPQVAEHIKEGRALWHVNGTAILPELMIVDPALQAPPGLNG